MSTTQSERPFQLNSPQPVEDVLSGCCNREEITRACNDCKAEFTIPKGTLFYRRWLRCEPCCEIHEREVEARREEAEKAKIQAEREERWQAVCPLLYREFDPSKLPAASRANLKKVMAWERNPKGLLLMGESGAGKTRVTYQLIRRLILEGVKVRVFDCVAFGHECQRAFMSDRGEEWANEVATAPVVFFDDLGKLRLSDRAECELFGVIERRAANMLPTIATTNSTGKMLEDRMSDDRGKPMVRRLREFNEVVTFTL